MPIVAFVDMILIPEAGTPDPFAVAVMSQPLPGWRIERRPFEVAQQRDRISFEFAAHTVRPPGSSPMDNQRNGFLPMTWLTARSKLHFRGPDVFRGRAPLAPCRKAMPVTANQGRSDDQPEYGPTVVAPTAR